MRNREGFSLTELLIATVVVAVLGSALTQMLIRNSRYVSRLETMMSARQAARAAMTVVAVNLRMVTGGGLVEATPKRVRVRVPYAWGIACLTAGGTTTVSLLPTDSMIYAAAPADGLEWWDAGVPAYQTISPVTVSTADATLCAPEGIQLVPGGRYISVLTMVAPPPTPGSVSYLYREIVYEFTASIAMPGRIGLYNKLPLQATSEEILVPFDTSAGFRFLVGSALTPQDNPPADLTTVRGLELKFVGASDVAPQGGSEPQTFDLRSKILFINREP
jgi:prepilin-type N-terminal cleavage/methylation domain-containing protein